MLSASLGSGQEPPEGVGTEAVVAGLVGETTGAGETVGTVLAVTTGAGETMGEAVFVGQGNDGSQDVVAVAVEVEEAVELLELLWLVTTIWLSSRPAAGRGDGVGRRSVGRQQRRRGHPTDASRLAAPAVLALAARLPQPHSRT